MDRAGHAVVRHTIFDPIDSRGIGLLASCQWISCPVGPAS